MANHTNLSVNSTSKIVNAELMELLMKITPTTVLGTSIYMAFAGNYDKSLLVSELQGLAKDNPGCMRKIIGKRAFHLLMNTSEKLLPK